MDELKATVTGLSSAFQNAFSEMSNNMQNSVRSMANFNAIMEATMANSLLISNRNFVHVVKKNHTSTSNEIVVVVEISVRNISALPVPLLAINIVSVDHDHHHVDVDCHQDKKIKNDEHQHQHYYYKTEESQRFTLMPKSEKKIILTIDNDDNNNIKCIIDFPSPGTKQTLIVQKKIAIPSCFTFKWTKKVHESFDLTILPNSITLQNIDGSSLRDLLGLHVYEGLNGLYFSPIHKNLYLTILPLSSNVVTQGNDKDDHVVDVKDVIKSHYCVDLRISYDDERKEIANQLSLDFKESFTYKL